MSAPTNDFKSLYVIAGERPRQVTRRILLPNSPSRSPKELAPTDLYSTFPASFGQERLWFLHQLSPSSSLYNSHLALRVSGPLDESRLCLALERLVSRHEILRTTFRREAGRLLQLVHPMLAPRFESWDPSDVDDEALQSVMNSAIAEPFDLSRGPLVRCLVLRKSHEERVLVFCLNHSIFDAESSIPFLRELSEFYQGNTKATKLEIQYGDYATWQRDWLAQGSLDEGISFWNRYLEGAPSRLDLSFDKQVTSRPTFRAGFLKRRITQSVIKRIELTAKELGTSPFMLMLTAFAATISKFAGQEDVVVGIPSSSRVHPSIEDSIGFFVNTIPVRLDLSGDPSLHELGARTTAATLSALEHQHVPFELIAANTSAHRNLSTTPIFQVMFAHRKDSPLATFAGMAAEHVLVPDATEPFYVTAEIVESGNGPEARFSYQTELFDEPTIASLADHVIHVLGNIGMDPSRSLSLTMSDAGLTRDPEVASRVVVVREPDVVPRAIEALVRRRPDAPAVGHGDLLLTRAGMFSQSLAIAGALQAQGISREEAVCVITDPGPGMVVGPLGAMLAGAAYVPIDPAQPDERIRSILKDVNARVVLSDSHLVSRLPAGVRKIAIQEPGVAGAAEPKGVDLRDLAYVIYTSGSTGIPKGVLVEHRALANLCLWHSEAFQVSDRDTAAQTAAFGFDACVWETWANLCSGARLLIAPRDKVAYPLAMLDWIEENGVTLCFLPTPLGERFLSQRVPPGGFPLRILFTGGEKLTRRPDPGASFQLVDLYGPTECAVIATSELVRTLVDDDVSPPPIGRPIDGVEVLVLDEQLNPVPAGVRGEIYITGSGVARGYLGRPDLTARSFLPHRGGGRIYSTGDLGRFRKDRRLEINGRVDQQVKIRGQRVELEEIEAVLITHPHVREAVVRLDTHADEKQLVAYVVPRTPTSASVLKDHLARRLPAQTIPSYIAFLEALPLTANGKVDYQALPRPEIKPRGRLRPRTGTEEKVAQVWCDVLGTDRFGMTEQFFDVGGTSLRLIDLLERLSSIYPDALTVADLFEHPTVAGVARVIDLRCGVEQQPEVEAFEL